MVVCVRSHIVAAVFGFDQLFWRQRGLDVIVGMRKLPTIANFLAVCAKKRSFNVAVSADFCGVMAVLIDPFP